MKQAEKAGIKKFVLASSIATAGKVDEETGQLELSDKGTHLFGRLGPPLDTILL